MIQKDLDEIQLKKRRCKMILKELYTKALHDAATQIVPEGLVSLVKVQDIAIYKKEFKENQCHSKSRNVSEISR